MILSPEGWAEYYPIAKRIVSGDADGVLDRLGRHHGCLKRAKNLYKPFEDPRGES
jgi:hypothetical protein